MRKNLLYLLDIPELNVNAFKKTNGRLQKFYGKSDPPPPPDYTGAANAQAAASKELTTQQTYSNRPTINTPWGQQSWQTNTQVDPSTGQNVTGWTSNVTLNAQQQKALDDQQAIQSGRSNAAFGLLDQATKQFKNEVDYEGLPDRVGSVDPFSFSGKVQTDLGDDWRQKAQDAAWQAQKPMLDESRSDLENQLSNMGLARGSEAWNREMRGRDDAETRARLQSMEAGRQESALDIAQMGAENQAVGQEAQIFQNMGNFQNTNRAQALAEEFQRRGYSLNELNALLTGQQVNMPQMPSNTPQSTSGVSQTPDLTGAMGSTYDAQMQGVNANNAQTSSVLGALGTAAFMFSDERLKEDIETVGLLPSGIRVVYYRYRGLPSRYIGVIAQEVQKIIPSAVICDPSGYLKVDYSKVH